MAEALVSVLLEQLTSILLEEAQQQVKLVIGVGKEINKLKSNFKFIRASLDDAEEKQIKERNIKLWLEMLKEICYDMEDVLDDWSTTLLKMKIEEADPNEDKVCCPLIPFFSPLMPCFSIGSKVIHRRDISLRIKEINESLDEIAKQKDRYQLTPRDINRHTKREESIAFAEVFKLHGRDDVKQQVVSSLLCGSSTEKGPSLGDVKTVCVVGMGGMGKTALAQLIYDDADIKSHFNKSVWFCVSEDFNEIQFATAILQSLDSKSAQTLDSYKLQNFLEMIHKTVEGKKVFLVLDDVWTDGSKIWELLKQAFLPAPGSRILVTTRMDTVAKDMESVPVFHLDELSDDVCWKILRQEAFVGRTDREKCKSLEGTGREIAKKCRGLPLAAKTLGGMLRFKEKEVWERVLYSEMWRLDLVKEKVFAPLLLSYYDLPSAIRRCFLYCSVFPKDHLFKRGDVIYEWMAQGYLSCNDDRELEEVGAEYFECLVERSFFQDFVKREDGSIRACKMHDVVVDFARSLMDNEFLSKKVSVENNHWEIRARHLLVTGDGDQGESESESESEDEDEGEGEGEEEGEGEDEDEGEGEGEEEGEEEDEGEGEDVDEGIAQFSMSFGADNKLRSLIIGEISAKNIVQDLQNLCIQSKYLRSLHFLGGYWLPVFPEEVGKLMHLRLLNLSGSKLEELPETICELCNLQSLYLQDCYKLRKLPTKMEKLINLRCLDTTDSALMGYPKVIGRLTSLRELRGIVVKWDRDNDDEFSLGDVGNLCHLRSLMLVILGGKVDVDEARRANLQSKKYLKDLTLQLTSSLLKPRSYIIKVLNPLPQVNVIFDDEKIKLIAKIREHARAIRAAYLYRLAGGDV